MSTKRIFVPDDDDNDDLLSYLTEVATTTVLPEEDVIVEKSLSNMDFMKWFYSNNDADRTMYLLAGCILCAGLFCLIMSQILWRCYRDDIQHVTNEMRASIQRRQNDVRKPQMTKSHES